MSKQSGFVLMEAVVVLSLIGIMTAMSVLSGRSLRKAGFEQFSRLAYGFVHQCRHQARAWDADVLIRVEQGELRSFSQGELIQALVPPSHVALSANRTLGFTGSGHSKFAGSLYLRSGTVVKRISLSVGLGRVSLN